MNVDDFPTLLTADIWLHDIYGGQSDQAIYAGVLGHGGSVSQKKRTAGQASVTHISNVNICIS